MCGVECCGPCPQENCDNLECAHNLQMYYHFQKLAKFIKNIFIASKELEFTLSNNKYYRYNNCSLQFFLYMRQVLCCNDGAYMLP